MVGHPTRETITNNAFISVYQLHVVRVRSENLEVKMVNYCAVIGCPNKGSKNVSYRKFPKTNPILNELLINITGRRKYDINWAPNSNSRICSHHYSKSTTKSKSDALVSLLENGENQGPMKIQCVECRETFDLEYDLSEKLYKLKSALCYHVRKGGKTATVSVPKLTQTQPESQVPTETSKGESEPNHDLKQHQIVAHEESIQTKAPNVRSAKSYLKSQSPSGNSQRIFDMNSLPSLCSFDFNPEINGNQNLMVNQSKPKVLEQI